MSGENIISGPHRGAFSGDVYLIRGVMALAIAEILDVPEGKTVKVGRGYASLRQGILYVGKSLMDVNGSPPGLCYQGKLTPSGYR